MESKLFTIKNVTLKESSSKQAVTLKQQIEGIKESKIDSDLPKIEDIDKYIMNTTWRKGGTRTKMLIQDGVQTLALGDIVPLLSFEKSLMPVSGFYELELYELPNNFVMQIREDYGRDYPICNPDYSSPENFIKSLEELNEDAYTFAVNVECHDQTVYYINRGSNVVEFTLRRKYKKTNKAEDEGYENINDVVKNNIGKWKDIYEMYRNPEMFDAYLKETINSMPIYALPVFGALTSHRAFNIMAKRIYESGITFSHLETLIDEKAGLEKDLIRAWLIYKRKKNGINMFNDLDDMDIWIDAYYNSMNVFHRYEDKAKSVLRHLIATKGMFSVEKEIDYREV